MQTIVTGGAGLIGSNIVRLLNSRGETDILVVDHLRGDALKKRNLEFLKFSRYMERDEFRAAVRAGIVEKPAVFYHLGACSSTTETDEKFLDDNNTGYTREMAEWCIAAGTRFVYASSAATYGAGEHGYDDDPALMPSLRPLNLYGWSKHKFDLWAQETGAAEKIAGLKYFNVFGPGEDHKGDMRSVVAKQFRAVKNDGRIALFKSDKPDCADGCQDRDFVYVKDAAAVTVWFGDHPDVCGVFNCGTGKARTWLDLAKAMFTAAGREPHIDFVEMPEKLKGKYQYHTQADTRRLRATGCNVPFRPLEDAVADYVSTHLSHFDGQTP